MIASGHALADVRKYTLGQIVRFHKLARKRERGNLVALLGMTRAAMWAEKDAYEGYVKKLLDG